MHNNYSKIFQPMYDHSMQHTS